jgi:hypothetical protein
MKRVVICSFVALLLAGWTGAAADTKSLKAAGTITEASIRGHMEFLASDAMNGRGSGTHDEWVTATYIASNLRRWGIEPLGDAGGYVQAVEVARSEATAPPVLSFGEARFVHGKEMIVQGLGRPHVSGPLVKYKAGATVPAGAIVLMPDDTAAAPAPGAAAMLTIETDQIRSRWDATGSRLPRVNVKLGDIDKQTSPAPLRIVLSKSAYARIAALDEGQTMTFDCPLKQSYTWNAIGQLKGRDPKQSAEVILLTAHLDHLGARGTTGDTIYNGADDDASGTTAVLEFAEALAKSPRPKRTVMFAWFGSEEAGGYGARNFLDHPPVPIEQIIANLEFEMIARPDEKIPPHSLWLTGYERSNLGPELAKKGAKIVADPRPDQNFFSRSDNIQLARRGVVAQTVSSFNLHRDYHQPSDELNTVDWAHMTDAIQSMWTPVLYLLNSTFKPDWLPGGKPGGGTR